MKKRLFSAFLAALIILCSLPISISAASGDILYSAENIEELYYEFESLSAMFEPMFGEPDGIAYRKYALDRENDKIMSGFITASVAILGDTPDKEYYTEVLVNMIVLFELDIAQQTEKQGQLDNLKTGKDYAYDVFDICLTIAGLDNMSKKATDIANAVSGGELIFNSRGHMKYYESIIRSYSAAESFLGAINEYSDNELLSEAAYELLVANELLYRERLEVAASITDDTVTYLASNFLNDLGYSLLKNLKEYKNDQSIQHIVDLGEEAYNALDNLISTGEAVFKTMLLGGDILFGTTNTFKRHTEIMAMNDIAEAIIEDYDDVTISQNMSPDSLYSNIRKKCDLYKMLLTTHARGEYLIYSLKTKDGALLSVISNWIDEFTEANGGITAHKWYNSQIDYFDKYYTKIDELFLILSEQNFVVSKGFELHDGFIVEVAQKTEVPDEYIGIYSYADFARIAESCPEDTNFTSINPYANEINTANYILMNDITFPEDHQTAGAFYGILDGNGYTISGLTGPLFLYIADAEVKNLGLVINYSEDQNDDESAFGAIALSHYGWVSGGVSIDNCFLKGSVNLKCRSGSFGGFIGYGDGVSITNCYNEADISIKTRQTASVGGICGESAEIQNCYNTGNIYLYTTGELTNLASSMNVLAGGIQGYNFSDDIANCYNTGSVSIEVPDGFHVYAGGIIGYNYESYNITHITSCYNAGRISIDLQNSYDPAQDVSFVLDPQLGAGGIVGYSQDNLHIEQCYNTGTISGEFYTGGIAGQIYDIKISDCFNIGTISGHIYTGGLVGRGLDKNVILSNCYSYGAVSGGLYVGALAGEINNAEEAFTDCYFQYGCIPTALGVKFTGTIPLTEEQMANASSYVGFDFFKVWRLREGDTAPLLRH